MNPQATSSSMLGKRSRREDPNAQASKSEQPSKRMKVAQQLHQQVMQRLPPQGTVSLPTAPTPFNQGDFSQSTTSQASNTINELDFLDGLPLWSSTEQRKTHVDRIRSLQTRIVEFLDLLPSHDLRTHRLAHRGTKESCKAMYGIITRHLDNKYSSRGVKFAVSPYGSVLTDGHILNQLHAEIRLVLTQSNITSPLTPELMEGLRKAAILNQEDYWLRAASIVFVKVRAVFGRSRTNIVIQKLTPELLGGAQELMESSHNYAVQVTWPEQYRDNSMLRLMAVEIRSQFVRMPSATPELGCLQACLRRTGELRSLLYKVSAATASVNGISVDQPLYVRTDGLLKTIERDLQNLIAQPDSINAGIQTVSPAPKQDLSSNLQGLGPQYHLSGRTSQQEKQETTTSYLHDDSNTGRQAGTHLIPVAETNASTSDGASSPRAGKSRPMTGNEDNQPGLGAEPRHNLAGAPASVDSNTNPEDANSLTEGRPQEFGYLSSNPLEFSLDEAGL